MLTATPDRRRGRDRVLRSRPGTGHSARRTQRVFERFYRVERHRSKTPGSTGLGLAIVRHIVERHGGRVWVDRGRGEMAGAAFLSPCPWPKSPNPAAASVRNGRVPGHESRPLGNRPRSRDIHTPPCGYFSRRAADP
ncbi:MAG: ATP-binding protein [Solidesulfovibrio sp.]